MNLSGGEGRRSLESVSYFAPPALVLATIFLDKIIEMPTPGYFGNVSLENHSGMQRFRGRRGGLLHLAKNRFSLLNKNGIINLKKQSAVKWFWKSYQSRFRFSAFICSLTDEL